MADNFVGLKVRVKLQNGATFQGVISEISGTVLRLINVFDSSVNSHVPSRLIDGSKIADLEIVGDRPGAEQAAAGKDTKQKRRSAPAHGIDTGKSWAGEDTAAYKDTEFDFQANLDRFDKKSVFDKIRSADTTDPSGRLVAINKTKRDFLPSENVLAHDWQDADHGRDPADLPAEPDGPAATQTQAEDGVSRLALVYDGREKFECPTFAASEAAAIERAAVAQFAMHGLQLTESAGNAVAARALAILGGKRRFERRRVQTNALPVVVVLVGNHDTGARAVAGARMLVNRRVRVVVLMHESPAGEAVEQQLRAFKAAGGKVTSRLEVLEATVKLLDAPPELVIDALQGRGGVRPGMHAPVQWALTQRAAILAVDLPAGVDPETGTVADNMGRAKWVLALGLPLTGLPIYMQGVQEDVGVAVADIGLPRRLFKSLSAGVVFESEWSVGVHCEPIAL